MNTTRDTGRNVGAVILIVVGGLFLFGQLFGVNVWDTLGGLFSFYWPFWIILPGAAFLLVAMFGDKRLANLAFPGAVVTGTGMILLFQDQTNRYESWAYLWGLYPVFVGLALIYVGGRTGNPTQVDTGRKAITVGLVLTAVFGVLMEGIIFNDGNSPLMRYLVPLALIGGGALLLLRRQPAQVFEGKPKNDFPAPYTNGKPKREPNPADVNPDLQRRIDEALADDER